MVSEEQIVWPFIWLANSLCETSWESLHTLQLAYIIPLSWSLHIDRKTGFGICFPEWKSHVNDGLLFFQLRNFDIDEVP